MSQYYSFDENDTQVVADVRVFKMAAFYCFVPCLTGYGRLQTSFPDGIF